MAGESRPYNDKDIEYDSEFGHQNSAMPLSLAIAKSVESYYRPGMMLWHYEHGLVLYASLKSASFHKDESVYPWVYSMYDRLIAEDGTIATYREGEFNLDQINAGRALFPLYDKTTGIRRYIRGRSGWTACICRARSMPSMPCVIMTGMSLMMS